MENSKSNNETKTIHVPEENPNPVIPSTTVTAVEEEEEEQQQQPQGSVLDVVSNGARQLPARTPFTNLSQVDADLALARTLQEQERAYMVLRMNGDGSDYGSWETGSYDYEDNEGFDDPSEEEEYAGNDDDEDEEENEEDAFDVHAHYEVGDVDVVELDPASFPDDESYARALQDAEDRDMAERLLALAGISNDVVEALEDHGHNSQEAWDDIDPDELSYEELIALGEMVGTESRGLSVDSIASLPSVMYKAGETQNGCSESCVICRLDFEEDETLTLLSCKHSYHPECINNWLCINKVCPVCSTEVSSSAPAT